MSDLKQLKITRGDATAFFHGSWYRGPNTNFIPAKADLAKPGAIKHHVLTGWAPEAPFISKTDRITSFGSCFARHVTAFLDNNGFNVFFNKGNVEQSHIIRFGEGIVNTFAVRQQFEWGFGVKDFPDNLWFGPNKEIAKPTEEQRKQTNYILNNTDIFIITLGLSEIWYDKQSGEAFWRAIPADMFDETRHGFRISTVEENKANLCVIRDLIRQYRPDASVVLTLSPVPLMATFRPVSCVTASSVSKSILRVAIDEFMRDLRTDDLTYYFPSYEIVKDVYPDPFKEDNRHPKDPIIQNIMRVFYNNFCIKE